MFDKTKHVISEIKDTLIPKYYVSCDYGTQNATVFLLWQKKSDGSWVCIKEYYYSGRDSQKQKTDSEYADDLADFLGDVKVEAIILDPSATSFKAELKRRGYYVKKAKNDVENGIRFVGTCLLNGKIQFMDCCKNTIKEFASYIWDSKAADRGEDKPLKEHDHAMDAVRYFCYTVIRKEVKYGEYI